MRWKGEIFDAALRLCAPIGVGGDVNWSKTVGFLADAAVHFFRPKSTLTTFDPSSTTTDGSSLPAASCGSGLSIAASTWNCSAKSTEGSTKAVIEE